MKISKKEFKRTIREVVRRKLAESFDYSDLMPEGAVEYSNDVDKFMDETIKKAKKLIEEGESILSDDILDSAKVQGRNHFILERIGFLKQLIASLVHRMEHQRVQ